MLCRELYVIGLDSSKCRQGLPHNADDPRVAGATADALPAPLPPKSCLAEASTDVAGFWPVRPIPFPDLMTPVEAAQYLRLDETNNHTPETAVRTLNYFRDQGELRATKYARHVWYRKLELDRFLANKTEP